MFGHLPPRSLCLPALAWYSSSKTLDSPQRRIISTVQVWGLSCTHTCWFHFRILQVNISLQSFIDLPVYFGSLSCCGTQFWFSFYFPKEGYWSTICYILEFILDSIMAIWSGSAAGKHHDKFTSVLHFYFELTLLEYCIHSSLCLTSPLYRCANNSSVQWILFQKSSSWSTVTLSNLSDPPVSYGLFRTSSTCGLFFIWANNLFQLLLGSLGAPVCDFCHFKSEYMLGCPHLLHAIIRFFSLCLTEICL